MWFPSRLQDSSDDRIQERGDECVRVRAHVSTCVCVLWWSIYAENMAITKAALCFDPCFFRVLNTS